MGTADTQLSEQHVLNLVRGTHGATADGNPHLIQIGAKYVARPTSVDSGDMVTIWADIYGYLHPHIDRVILDSFTTASGNGTGSSQAGFDVCKEIDIYVNINVGTGTSPTLDLLVDSRLDGTNWINIAHLTQITGTAKVGVHLTKAMGTALEVTGLGSDAGAGTLRRVGFGDDFRVRREIAGTSPSFSGTVYISGIA